MSVLAIRKLKTTEDDSLQAELAHVELAGDLAADMILAGAALIQDEAAGARLDEALEELVARSGSVSREHCAYYLGLAVGLRLRSLEVR